MKRGTEIAHRILDYIQGVISSPWWFFGNIIITLLWFGIQYILPIPWDPPKAFFPFTVLIYTLMTQWVENAVKVQQNLLQKAQQKQDGATADQIDRMEKVLNKVEDLMEQQLRHDEVLLNLVIAVEKTVDKIYAAEQGGECG